MNPIGTAPQNELRSSRLRVPPGFDLFVRHYTRHLSIECPGRSVPREGQEAAATQSRPSTYRADQGLAPEVPGDPRQTAWPCRYPFATPQKPFPSACASADRRPALGADPRLRGCTSPTEIPIRCECLRRLQGGRGMHSLNPTLSGVRSTDVGHSLAPNRWH